jgi:putative ABC transport system substrate-binding protein
MRRRDIIGVGASAALLRPLSARSQQPAPVIGFLSGRSPNDSIANIAAFRSGLGEFGYIDGQNVEIDFRWALGHYDQLAALATDLVRRKVAVIVATGGGVQSTRAAADATTIIPIVFISGNDPTEFGIVASLGKPSGNVTGISFLAATLMAKRIGLLHELVPKAEVIGVLGNPNNPDFQNQLRDAQAAARAIGLELVVANASGRYLRRANPPGCRAG